MDYIRVAPLECDSYSLLEMLNSVLEKITVPQKIKIILSVNDAEIICEKDKLEIVFVNIIHNAIHAIGEDTAGEINISNEIKEKHHLFEIKNSGPGIPENDITRIFEPLFTTKQKGTGLGLASCKNIIEQHGGNITVKNNPTTFTIRIPILGDNGLSLG